MGQPLRQREDSLDKGHLRGNWAFQARSPLYIAQQSPVPSEPFQPANPDGAHNGWRVVGDFLRLVGQEGEGGESMCQERWPG
jgi:hypothetical protein